MSTITVSIGRNVGATPMSAERWEWFTQDTRRAVVRYAETVHYVGRGSGLYEHALEDSYTIVASVANAHSLARLTKRLQGLCGLYAQDSIAVTSGDTQLVTPRA